jgi:hypothetical protein
MRKTIKEQPSLFTTPSNQVVLQAARALGSFTSRRVMTQTGLSRATVARAISELRRRGQVEDDGFELLPGGGTAPQYRAKGAQPKRRRPPAAAGIASLQDDVWREIRVRSRFSPTWLSAQLDKAHLSGAVLRYCKGLAAAGFITHVGDDLFGEPIYQITRDTGPDAPCVVVVWEVFDRNNGSLMRAPYPMEEIDGENTNAS